MFRFTENLKHQISFTLITFVMLIMSRHGNYMKLIIHILQYIVRLVHKHVGLFTTN